MSVRLLCAVAVISSLTTVAAQDPRQAWDLFLTQHPLSRAEWHPATGTPRAIIGRGLRVSDVPVRDAAHARALALACIREHAALLGCGPCDFPLDIAEQVGGLHVFVYRQRFAGLDVVGGRLDVRLRDNGVVAMLGSRAVPVPAGFDTVPRIAPAVAAAQAWRAHGLVRPAGAPAPRLVVWIDAEADRLQQPRLAWQVDVDRADAQQVGLTWVDARTGALLGERNDYHECAFGCAPPVVRAVGESRAHLEVTPGPVVPGMMDITGQVMAWANVGLSGTAAPVNVPLRGLRVTSPEAGSAFTDDSGFFRIPYNGSAPVTVTVRLRGRRVGSISSSQGASAYRGTFSATPGQPVAVQIYGANLSQFEESQSSVYWATDQVNEFVRTVLPNLRSSIDGITASTNQSRTCNASYSRNNMNFYAAGGGCSNTGYSTVVYHEWGHGLDDTYGGISQTDGLSEGWGDIVATYTAGDPVVGQGFRSGGGFIRTALNTRTYPAGGSVHTQGQTWMGFAWDLRSALIAKWGQTQGVAIANRIVLGSVVADATNQPGAVREVFLLDDDDGDLTNGTPNYDVLSVAASGRNLPYPVRNARNPGAYAAFGNGCAGTGAVVNRCQSRNTGRSPQGLNCRSNVTYAVRVTAPSDLTVRSFDFYTSHPAGVSVPIQILAASGNRPGAVLGTGTMQAGRQSRWYTGVLDQPVTIQAGQVYFLAYSSPGTPVEASTVNGGTQTPYFRNDGPGGRWNGPLTGFNWAYRVDCEGPPGATPLLTNTGAPLLGASFSITLSQAARNATGVLLFGASNTGFAGGPLPVNPIVTGAQGCPLLVSPDVAIPVQAPTGDVTLRFAVPRAGVLENAVFYNQFVVLDGGANPAGVVTSNGGQARIGKF